MKIRQAFYFIYWLFLKKTKKNTYISAIKKPRVVEIH